MGSTIILSEQRNAKNIEDTANPIRVIHASAPTRICDIGGWTDTWFAKYGNIFSIAVNPSAEVQIKCFAAEDKPYINVNLENYGDSYTLQPNHIKYGHHPLIDAAIESVSLPGDLSFEINVFSAMPPGASTGTSGAISVAIIGGLDALTEGRLSAAEMARLAHEVETIKLGQQGGIQDQLASAYGGINYIEMHQYPYATVSPIVIPEYLWYELEQRLLLVYIGAPHNSSKVHQKVIEKLGEDASENEWFHSLRHLAEEAKNTMFAGDFAGLGNIMNENTAIQRCLHKDLVSESLENVISICEGFGALGCKVNGAGGDGGTVTVLTDRDMAKKRRLIKALNEKGYQMIPISLARHGVRIW